MKLVRDRSKTRAGLTMPEVVVLLLIVVILLALLLSAIQNVREAAARTKCANNLRQLAMGIHHFEGTNRTLPPYWNAYPRPESMSVKGSWFDHVLPYVEQQPLYDKMVDSINKTKSNWDGYDVTVTETYTVWVVDKAGYWDGPPDTWVVDKAGYWEGPPDTWVIDTPGHYDWVESGYNGHITWTWSWVAAVGHWQKNGGTWHPATGHWQKNGGKWVPAVGHNEKRTRTITKHISNPGGIFTPGAADATFAFLQCPSDPSVGSYPDAGRGKVYLTTNSWGSTNYLANWHALGGSVNNGYQSLPQSTAAITDGLSNTVLLAEGYSWCDGKGRVALNSWDSHSLGITWSLKNSTVDIGDGNVTVNYPNGMPNTIPFQIRPKPLALAECPRGADCCNNWAAQTGHTVLNVAMGDGSVRSLTVGTSRKAWTQLLIANDGQTPVD